MKMSVTRRSPPAARATPESSSRPATVTFGGRLRPRSRAGFPRGAGAARANGSGTKTESGVDEERPGCRAGHEPHLSHGAVAARVHPEDLHDLSRSIVDDSGARDGRREGAVLPEKRERLERRDRDSRDARDDEVAAARDRGGRLAERVRDAPVRVLDRRRRRDADGHPRTGRITRVGGAAPAPSRARERGEPSPSPSGRSFRRGSRRPARRGSRRPRSASPG